MISNSSYGPAINMLLEELGQKGLHGLSELLSRLFNEMMKAERERSSNTFSVKSEISFPKHRFV